MKRLISFLILVISAAVFASCGGSGGGNAPASSEKSIMAFSFANPAATGTIDENAKTIALTEPYGTDVTALVATFTTTGTTVEVNSVVQVSGTTQNDFTNPVIYTVIAQDGSTVAYTVTVTIRQRIWTWMSGTNTVGQPGVYGTKGVAASTNVPGARDVSVSWTDRSNNLWLFGGFGYTASGGGDLNDLWKFDGANWTWVSGANTVNQKGVYGTKGVGNASNVPGARYLSVSWIDGSNNLWLFGGYGYSLGGAGYLNDLWKFDPVSGNWTWVSGANLGMNIVNQPGVYGTKGTADASNVPGARSGSVSWIDSSGNLWLFGGQGYGPVGTGYGYLNDLWKFDPVSGNWTWVGGANIVNQNGVYGTKGTADASNDPGARSGSVSWIDSNGNLWLFGGNGYDSTGALGDLNDLWKFDGANWTWVSGANTVDQTGVYGTQGVAASSNIPGARYRSVSWIDKSNNLWLFGGQGYDSTGVLDDLNDLWKFDGANWTWVSGANTVDQPGVYGTQGVADANNVPGARSSSVSWIDGGGNLWLLGGYAYDSVRTLGYLNDLWRYW
jgi:hypothetical protein